MAIQVFVGSPTDSVKNWILSGWDQYPVAKFSTFLENGDFGSLPPVGTDIQIDYIPDFYSDPVKTDWTVIGYNQQLPLFIKYKRTEMLTASGYDEFNYIYLCPLNLESGGNNDFWDTVSSNGYAPFGTQINQSPIFKSDFFSRKDETMIFLKDDGGSYLPYDLFSNVADFDGHSYSMTYVQAGDTLTCDIPETIYLNYLDGEYKFAGNTMTLQMKCSPLVYERGISGAAFAYTTDTSRSNAWQDSTLRKWLNFEWVEDDFDDGIPIWGPVDPYYEPTIVQSVQNGQKSQNDRKPSVTGPGFPKTGSKKSSAEPNWDIADSVFCYNGFLQRIPDIDFLKQIIPVVNIQYVDNTALNYHAVDVDYQGTSIDEFYTFGMNDLDKNSTYEDGFAVYGNLFDAPEKRIRYLMGIDGKPSEFSVPYYLRTPMFSEREP